MPGTDIKPTEPDRLDRIEQAIVHISSVLESLRQDHDHAATGASRMASRLDLIDSAVSALAATVAERKRATVNEPVKEATPDVDGLLTLLDTRQSVPGLWPTVIGVGSLLDLDGRATYESMVTVMTDAQGYQN
ncbi:hypothetical protein GCM10010435_54790 [Winogradskya consettensis]|uniref:Uncharacterized protein n=1 Tax=Winogradskya consettensis TaxID=113560 RepID=A0A919S9L9_9ACTN|nr:hypothetical protein [Actinoplanes consettensis]GIM67698.1 hypothetical protein Aco04nite_07530 [Actinoplanes consettensis]